MIMNNKMVKAECLLDYCASLFEKVGVPRDESYINAENLVDADLTGVESHGVSRMPIYLKRIRMNAVNPRCTLRTVSESPSTAVIDACNSMGAVVGVKTMELAIEKAKKTGISFIVVKNSNHYGTAAYHAKIALKHNMIGFTATNGAARMAPWGGKDPFFGTNPFAVAVPAGKHLPIIADMATSVVALGKIILAAKKNLPIPLGWALNKFGEETTNPKEVFDGKVIGTPLPFGGPKGSAIALLIDVLTGILAGSTFGPQIKDMYADFDQPTTISHLFGAINVEAFVPVSQFTSSIDELITMVKQVSPAKGVDEIFLPGEIELRKKEKRLAEGIPISEAVLEDLRKEGELCRVECNL
ncbi:Malate dehydrogenase [Thermosinus carboxydivorans Nor1]|uniref:Malate dehydrogenase n=2 Tax=Thermosinus TaxID=261684 RepID=A1HMI4_9FIRM|nr:Malate dehydrogenase [Thermosinus carboxydivorans Nor1]